MHGKGIMIWKDGSKYQGEFKENKIEGTGHKVFVNGDQYLGEWVNDQMNGHGTLTKADGEQVTGNWQDGEFVPEEGEENGTPWKHLRKV